jgi:large subunit ribosomal protein L25
MKKVGLNGSLRTETGKKQAKLCRKKDMVPGILYGGSENVMLAVNEKELKLIVYTPHVYIINLNIDGKKHDAIIKDMQFHPVSDKITHIDFLEISKGKNVSIGLPVIVTGQAEGVKQGGKLQLITRKLHATGDPYKMPEELLVDVTNLELGKTISVGDLKIDHVHLTDPKSTVVLTVKLTRVARTTTVEEGATPAAGETPAAEAKE